MTAIDKLSIRGIRSFSPNDAQVIEIFKPLTLIVGKNGSGKTTIIECLKMATTGDLPPNCRGGQAFVNDPNALGTSEVKAQIKLKFTASDNKPALCNRSFSLTQKPQKREYKAFEAALQTLDEHNVKQCLSYKPSDLNRLIPEMMGVSHAVLESVIFVHQEDSCWPLAEDKVLKQRFDDIFAATEYTKALDNLKTYKNDKAKEIRALAAELDACETKLKTAHRLRTEVENASATQTELTQAIENAKQQTQDAKEKLPRLREVFEKRDQVREECTRLSNDHQHALDAATEARNLLHKNFECELDESDEELRDLETRQASQVMQLSADLDSLKARIEEIEDEITRTEQSRDKQRSLLEQERAQEAHNRKIESEAVSIADSFTHTYTLVLTSPPNATATQRCQGAADALGKVLHGRQQELSRAKEERNATNTNLGNKVQKLRVELDHSSEAALALERDGTALERKVRQMQERADASGAAVDDTTLAQLKQEARDLKSQVDAAQDSLDSCELAAEIAECKNRRRTAKDKIAACNEEMQLLEREGDRQAKLRRQEETVEEKRRKLQAGVSERRGKLAQVISAPTDEDVMRMLQQETLHREVIRKKGEREEEVDTKEHEVRIAEEKLQKKAQEVVVKQEAIKTLEATSIETEEDLRRENALYLTDGYAWDERQKEMDEAHAEKVNMVSSGKGIYQFFQKGKAKADTDQSAKCLMCDQHLTAAARDYLAHKCNQFRSLGADSEATALEVRSLDEAARKHKRAHETFRAYKRRKVEDLPAAKATLDSLKGQQSTLRQNVDRLKAEVKELRDRYMTAHDLMREVDHLRNLHKDLAAALGDAAQTQSGMQSGMHSCLRPKEQVAQDREEAQGELDLLEKRIEEKGLSLDQLRSELSELRTRHSQKKLEYTEMASAKERMQEQEEQLVEMKARLASLRADAKSMREGERPKRDQLQVAESELLAEEQRLDGLIRDHDARVAQCNADYTRLTDLARRLTQNASAQRAQLMKDVELRAAEAERAVSDKKAFLKEKVKQRDELDAQIRNQGHLNMQMRANLQYRDLLAKERALKARHDEAQRALHQLDGPANEAHREWQAAQATIQKCEMERNRFVGSKETVVASLKSLRAQLNERQYKNIDAEHREKLIEHKTVQMVVEDLNRYYKALNAALMRFHETKMADINKSITELWNKTYKGSDIDGISIKTEDEGQTADGRRKQSYRVVMRKGDTTLDMRGRCSAGQKVLACLVIRLALAETFCINCGILALDEPTTNLDSANIASLAEAVNDIIKARRQQANFQLLVITHDEDFVKQIGRSENASHYFHVEKRFLKEGDPPASTISKLEMHTFG